MTRERNAAARRVANTSPSHPLSDYAGRYEHPGYGEIEIELQEGKLIFNRNNLALLLQHWHYDAWVFEEHELFWIHEQHPFERASQVLFETDAVGAVAAFCMPFEPAVAPIRFAKK